MSTHFDFEILESPEEAETFYGVDIYSDERGHVSATEDALYCIGADAAAAMAESNHGRAQDYIATADKFVAEKSAYSSKRTAHVVRQSARFLAQQFYLIRVLCSLVPRSVAAKLVVPREIEFTQAAPARPAHISRHNEESIGREFADMFCFYGVEHLSDDIKVRKGIDAWKVETPLLRGEELASMRKAVHLYEQIFLHHRPPIAPWEVSTSASYTTRRHWAEKAAQSVAYVFLCSAACESDRVTDSLRWLVRSHGTAMTAFFAEIVGQPAFRAGGGKKLVVHPNSADGQPQ